MYRPASPPPSQEGYLITQMPSAEKFIFSIVLKYTVLSYMKCLYVLDSISEFPVLHWSFYSLGLKKYKSKGNNFNESAYIKIKDTLDNFNGKW